MPRVPPQDRLQPSLLDRITDHNPSAKQESLGRRVFSMQDLRERVLRDIAWLLNTGNLDAIEELDDYPLVAESTLNFGIPHLAGTMSSNIEAADMERRLKQAIWRFEPRILRDSVNIKLSLDKNAANHNAVTFLIEGMLWAEPVPLHIYLKTEVDLETGTFSVTEQGDG